jgi:hypothetical protein
MILSRDTRLLAPALVAAAMIGGANAQERLAAGQGQDGVYVIDITTSKGSCDKAYHWMIAVSGGRVSSAGNTPLDASGQITRRGVVDLAFERFGQTATARGRLAGQGGSGTWSSSTMQCSGSWRAARHG